jgi:hypothetical protein
MKVNYFVFFRTARHFWVEESRNISLIVLNNALQSPCISSATRACELYLAQSAHSSADQQHMRKDIEVVSLLTWHKWYQ